MKEQPFQKRHNFNLSIFPSPPGSLTMTKGLDAFQCFCFKCMTKFSIKTSGCSGAGFREGSVLFDFVIKIVIENIEAIFPKDVSIMS